MRQIARPGQHLQRRTAPLLNLIPSQRVLARVIAQLSLRSRFWYPAARFAVVVSRPMRRQVSRWLA